MVKEIKDSAPVIVGDEVEVLIENLGAKGDGVAKVEGFVVFVPDGQVGETYTVRITKVFPGRMAFSEIVR